MVEWLGEVVGRAAPGMLFVLAFRTMPFAVAAAVDRRLMHAARASVVLAYALLPITLANVVPDAASALIELAVVSSYLMVGALATYIFSRWWARRCTHVAVFVWTCFIFIVLPGVLFSGPTATLLLMASFELAFSAFSYCVEPARHHHPRPLADCLTFLLVNPTLVYVAQGTEIGAPEFRPAYVLRALVGAGTMIVQVLAGMGLAQLGFGYGAAWSWNGEAASYPHFVATLGAHLVVQYFGHSGLASLQIGLMGCLGRQLPERYHYPFLARDPLDLWRRWNTYLGLWLQRYVFFPLAVRYQQRLRSGPRDAGKAIAVLATFAVGGLTHELVGYARIYTLPIGAVLGFLLCGLAIVAWLGLARTSAALGMTARMRAARPVVALASRVATSSLLLVFGWVALPALAGFGLPLPLQRWLGL